VEDEWLKIGSEEYVTGQKSKEKTTPFMLALKAKFMGVSVSGIIIENQFTN
jgi:hypothetical protein